MEQGLRWVVQPSSFHSPLLPHPLCCTGMYSRLYAPCPVVPCLILLQALRCGGPRCGPFLRCTAQGPANALVMVWGTWWQGWAEGCEAPALPACSLAQHRTRSPHPADSPGARLSLSRVLR